MKKTLIHTRAAYLRDAVFAANDGVVTTFAIVAGAQGASLSSDIVLILGVANLLADGFSMASGNYLGVRSEREYRRAKGGLDEDLGPPATHGIITFIFFVIAGTVSLVSFLLGLPGAFLASTVLVAITFFIIGFIRGRYTNKRGMRAGLETLFVGGFAASVAYAVGYMLDKYII